MKNRGNLLAGLVVFGMALALLFSACTPMEGDIDTIHQKALENTSGGSVSFTVISSVNIQITAPVKGYAPSTTGSTTDTGYTLASVSWQPNNNPFQGSTKYTATVTLVTDSGYTFTGLATAKINADTASISNNTGGSVILSYEFPATLANTVTGITINTQPAKLSYNQGEALDLAGLTVTLTYDAGPADNVAFTNFGTYGITTSPVDGTTLSRSTHDGKPVTVSHGSFSKTTNNLTVIAPPSAPQGFTATPSNVQVVLSWTAPSDNGGSEIIRYEVTSGSTWATASSNTSHTFSSLTNGTSYTFQVRAVNAAGNGTPTSRTATPATTPSAPQNPTATPSNGQVALSWSAPSSTGGSPIIKYEASSNNGVNWVDASSSTGHTFTGLTNNQSYNFQVRAVNAIGPGATTSISSTPYAVYTVTFNINGGTGGQPPVQNVNSGGKATKPTTDPTRTNYVFDKWCADTSLNTEFDFNSTTINANTTIYAKWLYQFTVTYNANRPKQDPNNPSISWSDIDIATGSGGSTASTIHVEGRSRNLEPNGFTCRGHEFAGWATTPSGGVIYTGTLPVTLISSAGVPVPLYAVWTRKTIPSPSTLVAGLNWIEENALTGGDYTITISSNDTSFDPRIPSTGTCYSSYTIRLIANAVQTITLSKSGSMFTIENGIKLVLGSPTSSSIGLKGRSDNNSALITIKSGGQFEMISGTISGNTILNDPSGINPTIGGGVHIAQGGAIFTMSGGTISGNTVPTGGGGVFVIGGTFTMNGGTISGNTAASNGGGVFVLIGGTFKKTGGTIYGNDGVFTLSNTATNGHAAYVQAITGSRIRNTTAGAGVNLDSSIAGTAGGWEN